MMNSSNQVKQLRLQRAWSQEQLAELAGLSVRTFSALRTAIAQGWKR
jgi:transcriptional regulator with XRE-family HTH domain